jgi:hypothetical protein
MVGQSNQEPTFLHPASCGGQRLSSPQNLSRFGSRPRIHDPVEGQRLAPPRVIWLEVVATHGRSLPGMSMCVTSGWGRASVKTCRANTFVIPCVHEYDGDHPNR